MRPVGGPPVHRPLQVRPPGNAAPLLPLGQRSSGFAPQAFPKGPTPQLQASGSRGSLPVLGAPLLAAQRPLASGATSFSSINGDVDSNQFNAAILAGLNQKRLGFRPEVKGLSSGSPDLADAALKAAALVSGKASGTKNIRPKAQFAPEPFGVREMNSAASTQAWLEAAATKLMTQDDVQSWLKLAADNAASLAGGSSSEGSATATSTTANAALDHQENMDFKTGEFDQVSTPNKASQELTGMEVLKAMAATQEVDKQEKKTEVETKPKVARGGYAMVSSMNRAAHIEDPTKMSSVPSEASKRDAHHGKSEGWLSEGSCLYIGNIPIGIGESLIRAECTKYGEISCIHYDAEAADLIEGGWALVRYAKHEATAAAVGRLSRRAVLFGAAEKVEVRFGTRSDALRIEKKEDDAPLEAQGSPVPVPVPVPAQVIDRQAHKRVENPAADQRNVSEHVGKEPSRPEVSDATNQLKHTDALPESHHEEVGQEKRARHSSHAPRQRTFRDNEYEQDHNSHDREDGQQRAREHEEAGQEKRARHSVRAPRQRTFRENDYEQEYASHDREDGQQRGREHEDAGQERRARHSSRVPRQRTFREHDYEEEHHPQEREDCQQRGRDRRHRHDDYSRERTRERRRRRESAEPGSRSARGGRGSQHDEETPEGTSVALAIPAKARKPTGFHLAQEAVPSKALPVLADEPTGCRQVGVRGCWAEFAGQDNRSYWVNIITGEKTLSRPQSYDNIVRTGASMMRDTRGDTNNSAIMSSGHSNVFVGSLPLGVSEFHFRQLFERFGSVTAVKLVPEAHYGFVKFATTQNARAAIEGMNGYVLLGQQIQCKFANIRV